MTLLHRAVCVTGASSIVGSQLVPMLKDSGVTLALLGRKTPEDALTSAWHFLDLQDLTCDLPEITADTLVHTASLWLLPGWIERFHACGVRRLIGFSSTSRFTKQASGNSYEIDVVNRLVEAEDAVIKECERLRIAWTIFRPTLIYGGANGDRNIADIARFIRRFGFFPLFGAGSGLRQPVGAKDLATATLLAMNSPLSCNKAYNLSGGETLTYKEMVQRVFHTIAKPPRFLRIPMVVFGVAVSIARIHPRFSHLTSDMALRMQADLVFDHAEAHRDFGYAPEGFQPSYLTRMR